jgi:hypothetical protein
VVPARGVALRLTMLLTNGLKLTGTSDLSWSTQGKHVGLLNSPIISVTVDIPLKEALTDILINIGKYTGFLISFTYGT